MGIDLQTDPYVVESEREDDGLFVDAAAADNRQAVSAPDGDSASDAADNPDAETAEARFLPGPQEPTQSQAEDHRASGHIPFRSWCSHCVRARGTGEQDSRRNDKRKICVFSFDYLHFDEAGSPVPRDAVRAGAKVSLTLLVAKDSLGKAAFAHVVPQKGVDPAHYSVDALVKDIAWLGYTRLSLRSDNEPAILQLLRHALIKARLQIENFEQLQRPR